jgi:hypothetical protein
MTPTDAARGENIPGADLVLTEPSPWRGVGEWRRSSPGEGPKGGTVGRTGWWVRRCALDSEGCGPAGARLGQVQQLLLRQEPGTDWPALNTQGLWGLRVE